MNCEQCQDEVFELIEREAHDPAGVRAILDRCPECRALFDEMKATLNAVGELPLDDPPAHVDAKVLVAAADRRAKVTTIRKSRLQAPPWAMAAIAVLAVGVGVWSIPRGEDSGTETALGATVAESEADVMAGQAPVSAPEPQLDQKKQIAPTAEAPAKSSLARRERAISAPKAPKARKTRTAPAARAKVAERVSDEVFAADGVAASDMPSAPAAGAGAGARTAKPAGLAAASLEEETKEDRDDVDETCRETVAAFEKRRRKDETYTPDPEHQLTLGRCYAKRGNTKQARTWLHRAATHDETKSRAQAALQKLTPN